MIIPAINCLDFETAQKRISEAEKFSEWIHIDVADGKFAPDVTDATWGNQEELKQIKTTNPNVKFEVHLMVNNPDEVFESWIDAGAKRIIVHAEVVQEPRYIQSVCNSRGVELMLSVLPETPIDILLLYRNSFFLFQVLEVKPGFAGQRINNDVFSRVKFLRQKSPQARIEVDGGVNLETASLLRDAGADILISASFIFDSENPEETYKKLEWNYTTKK
jgi:ribulose-phosphate 3-epimerase